MSSEFRFEMLSENPIGDYIMASQIPILWLRDERYVFSMERMEGGFPEDFKKVPKDALYSHDKDQIDELIDLETKAMNNLIYTLSQKEYGKGLSFLVTKQSTVCVLKKTNFSKLLKSTKSGKIRDVSNIDSSGKGSKVVIKDTALKVVQVEGVSVGTNNFDSFLVAIDLLGSRSLYLNEINEMESLFSRKKSKEKSKEKSEERVEEKSKERVEKKGKKAKVKEFVPEPYVEKPIPIIGVRKLSERRKEKKTKIEGKVTNRRAMVDEIEFKRE